MRPVSRLLVAFAVGPLALACAIDTTGTGPAQLATSPSRGDASDDGDARSDGGGEASAHADASSDVAPEAAPVVCDRDNDGHKSKACGGDDCCDDDARVMPGATDFHETPNVCGDFDYDCDGYQTRRYGIVGCQLDFGGCSGDGFGSSTACGVAADFVTCGYVVISCNETHAQKTQPCR
jgi:hypothetical protein